MIKVTVEMVSARDPSRSKVLGIAEISNISGGDSEFANYLVRLSKWEPLTEETWRTGRLYGFKRHAGGPWDLLYLALGSVVGFRSRHYIKKEEVVAEGSSKSD